MDPLPLEDISDREEGELVEDELEDVSDCPLTAGSPLNPGKSVSPPEILNGVCLSKATKRYVHEKTYIHYGNQRRRIRRKKRNSQNGVPKRSNHSKLRSSIIEILSDSEDEMIDPRYAKQLREALCRESAQCVTNNNLKTRLKALIDNQSHSEDDANLKDLRDLALLSTSKPLQLDNELSAKDIVNSDFNPCDVSDSVDPELQELRLEALKSVVLKNHERRKRKADQVSDNTKCEIYSDSTTDINKENDQSIINNKMAKLDVECIPESEIDPSSDTVDKKSTDNTDSLEEDADILRAVLLASMSKNLSNKPNDEPSKVPFELPKVVVKPLIINLNADSDSDTENLESPSKTIKNTVTEFLKKQRAEAEANVRKKPNNINTPTSYKRNDLMNKSVMKLLPRSQQLEYHKLKQQLLNAHRRVKMRKNVHKPLHNNKKDVNNYTNNNTKRLSLYKTVPSLTNNRILVNNSVVKNKAERRPDTTINHFHTTLGDLQITKNGRLHMKGKYRSLEPLLRQINKASTERQQHEIRIKKLLQDIQIARIDLAKSHQNYTNLVHELVKEKLAIDNIVNPSPALPVQSPVLNEEIQNIKKKEPEAEKLDSNVTKILVNDLTEEISVPKYDSPLNYSNNATDPATTICPYDLLGVCKDNECPHMHYS